MKKTWTVIIVIVLALLASACNYDDYETGDGCYSYLRTDFCLIHTTGNPVQADRMTTDDGQNIEFQSPVKVSWAEKSDTIYRALVNYDVSSNNVFSVAQVVVMGATEAKNYSNIIDDPLDIESAWVGGRFLNIGLAFKVGNTENNDLRQKIGLILDSLNTDNNGQKHLYIRILHAQNGVPEYYTVRNYISMPLTSYMQGAIIHLSANTYSGEKTFSFNN